MTNELRVDVQGSKAAVSKNGRTIRVSFFADRGDTVESLKVRYENDRFFTVKCTECNDTGTLAHYGYSHRCPDAGAYVTHTSKCGCK